MSGPLLCRNDTQCRPRFGDIWRCRRHVGDTSATCGAKADTTQNVASWAQKRHAEIRHVELRVTRYLSSRTQYFCQHVSNQYQVVEWWCYEVCGGGRERWNRLFSHLDFPSLKFSYYLYMLNFTCKVLSHWSSGMIPRSGRGGPEFESRMGPVFFVNAPIFLIVKHIF